MEKNIVWIFHLGVYDKSSVDRIGEMLTEERITYQIFDPDTLNPLCGILFLHRITDELFSFMERFSISEKERIAIVILFQPEQELLWNVMRNGIPEVHVIHKTTIASVSNHIRRWRYIDEIVESPLCKNNLIGTSSQWISILRQIIELSCFSKSSVLITGESGTGKEMVARLVHTLDQRPNKGQLVILDCTTVVPELSGSEFFGHEKGSFTGAVVQREGAFAMADNGTLFLDEVGELPLVLQAQLLRVIQEQSYKRIGSNEWKQISFRLICATNRDLVEERSRGGFRSDFYYRIANWVCELPPLRERRNDVVPLANHFLKQEMKSLNVEFTSAVKDYLECREYPGNIRELKQLVTRIAQRHIGDGPVTLGDIPPDEREKAGFTTQRKWWRETAFESALQQALISGVSLKEITSITADTAIRIALDSEENNVKKAAMKLKVTERAIQLRKANQKKCRFNMPDSALAGTSELING